MRFFSEEFWAGARGVNADFRGGIGPPDEERFPFRGEEERRGEEKRRGSPSEEKRGEEERRRGEERFPFPKRRGEVPLPEERRRGEEEKRTEEKIKINKVNVPAYSSLQRWRDPLSQPRNTVLSNTTMLYRWT